MTQRVTRIKAVNHAKFYWKNNRSQTLKCKPRTPTVCCIPVDQLAESCRERGLKPENQDVWQPVVKLYLSMARVIVYEGEVAQGIWNDYKAGIFGKKKSTT